MVRTVIVLYILGYLSSLPLSYGNAIVPTLESGDRNESDLGLPSVQVLNEVERAEIGIEAATAGLQPADLKPVDESERLRTLVNAFKKLPAPEAERLGVDLDDHSSAPIVPGSPRALKLMAAWKERQKELKAATESMVKPVEYMAMLLSHIQLQDQDGSSTHPASPTMPAVGEKLAAMQWTRMEALAELESVVDDIDNARDLHTIGGWRVLARLLAPEVQAQVARGAGAGAGTLSSSELAGVAYVMGTATKSSYDFQLWALEGVDDVHGAGSGGTILQALVSLARRGSDEERRRAMYAVASAARGNQDVQEALQLPMDTDFVTVLFTLLSDSDSAGAGASADAGEEMSSVTSVELRRKGWTFVADMLEEAAYVQTQAADLVAEAMDTGADVDEVLEQLRALRPLGRAFCTPLWRERLLAAVAVETNDLSRFRAAVADTTADTTTGSAAGAPGGEFTARRAMTQSILSAVVGAAQTCKASGESSSASFFAYASEESLAAFRAAATALSDWVEDSAGDLAPTAAAALAALD